MLLPRLEEIEKRRRRLGLTQKQLAFGSQTSQSLIAKMEKGRLIPSYQIATRIFSYLDSAETQEEKTAKLVMHKPVITIDSNEKISKAISLLKRRAISQLPVVKGNQIVGAITAKEILDASKNGFVKDYMRDSFPTVNEDTPLSLVKSLIRHHDAVIVVKKGVPSGMITGEDLLSE